MNLLSLAKDVQVASLTFLIAIPSNLPEVSNGVQSLSEYFIGIETIREKPVPKKWNNRNFQYLLSLVLETTAIKIDKFARSGLMPLVL